MSKKHEVFMGVAGMIAQLGTCDRKQVGAVVVRDGRCITWGYNGAPPGLPHCNAPGRYHQFEFSPTLRGKPSFDQWAEGAARKQVEAEGCRNATHAEANALAFAAKQGISTEGATLYVTVAPCDTCARLIIAAGVIAVYYKEAYRDTAGVELLERARIPVNFWLTYSGDDDGGVGSPRVT